MDILLRVFSIFLLPVKENAKIDFVWPILGETQFKITFLFEFYF